MKVSELKPCPFCGGKDIFHYQTANGWCVCCRKCAAVPYGEEKRKCDASKKWNKRAAMKD